jgi:hypothetical protein
MTLDEIVANSGAVATKTSDHEPILLTYKELAAKIRFSYARVRYLASTGFLDERGLTYVMGSPRVDWIIFQRTAFDSRRTHKARQEKGIRKTNGR